MVIHRRPRSSWTGSDAKKPDSPGTRDEGRDTDGTFLGFNRVRSLLDDVSAACDVVARDLAPEDRAAMSWSDDRYFYVEIPLRQLRFVEFDLSSGPETLFLRVAHPLAAFKTSPSDEPAPAPDPDRPVSGRQPTVV